MKPDQIAGTSESSQQRALFAAVNAELWQLKLQDEKAAAWDGCDRTRLAPLRWFHSIPNGGARGDDARSRAIRGGTMIAEGVIRGIPDTFLPYPRLLVDGTGVRALGCYIEMKKPGVKKASAEQNAFKDFALRSGFAWHLCDDWLEAFTILKNYLTT